MKGLIRQRYFPVVERGIARADPLLLNALYLLGVAVIPGLFGLLYWTLAGRWFTVEQVGLAGSLVSAVTLLAGLGTLGLGYGLQRFLPEVGDKPRLVNNILSLSLVLASLVGVCFIYGVRRWFPELSIDGGLVQGIFLLFVLSVALGSLARDACVAGRQARFAWLYTLLAALTRPLFLVLLVGRGTAGLVASSALAYMLALGVAWSVFLPATIPGYRPGLVLDRALIALLLPYSAGNYLVTLFAQLSQSLLPLLVLRQLGAASSGYAYVALMIAGLLTAPGVALSTSALVESSHAPGSFIPFLRSSAGLGMLITSLAAGLLYFLAPAILSLFGLAYAQQAVPLLRLLALSTPLTVLVQFYFTVLRFWKKTRRLVLLAGLWVLLTLGLIWTLLPHLGITAIGAGMLFANLLLVAVTIWFHSRFKRGPLN